MTLLPLNPPDVPSNPEPDRPAHHVPLDWDAPRPVNKHEDGRYTVTYRSLPKGNTTSKWFEPSELEEAKSFNEQRWKLWVDAGRPTPSAPKKQYKTKAKGKGKALARRQPAPQPSLASLLPQLGAHVKVAGLILNDDDSVSVLLRDQGQSWLTALSDIVPRA